MADAEPKIYVLDTSVLIEDPRAIDRLEDNIIVVPIVVIEELDMFKKGLDLLGASARTASRIIDEYRQKGDLREGVPTKSGGLLKVDCNGTDWSDLPIGLERKNDNAILLTAKAQKGNVVLLTRDTNLRIKAAAWGINSEDYKNDDNIRKIEELPPGLVDIEVPENLAGYIGELARQKNLSTESISCDGLHPNHCCRLINPDGKYVLAVFKPQEKEFNFVEKPLPKSKGNIAPVNDEQAFAYHLLCDPTITIVALGGVAGAGKTLMSQLAGYKQLDKDHYDTMLVWRPNTEIGNPMGFLPGTLEEKFEPWKKPIIRNMRLIIGGSNTHTKDGASFDKVEELMKAGLLEIDPINFEQGGTVSNTFIIVDESQNLNRTTIKILITRCGERSKVVLTGDLQQICTSGNPDPTESGLARVIEVFTGQPNFGHIIMPKSERSALAEQAARLL